MATDQPEEKDPLELLKLEQARRYYKFELNACAGGQSCDGPQPKLHLRSILAGMSKL